MVNMKKNWLLIFLCASGPLYGFQNQAQPGTQTYYQDVSPIKVHLSLNQDDFLAGDTIFFRAVVQPVGELAPASMRTILNIQLRNDVGAILQHQTVRIEKGEAANQLILSPALPSGNYRVVAYNDWMEKYDPSLYFQKSIRIGDTSVKKESYASNSYRVYPEGGILIAGLSQQIIVSGVPGATGLVVNNGNETVQEFKLDEYGLASFSMTPSREQKYTARFNDGASTIALPEVKADGFAVNLAERNEHVVKVDVRLPAESTLRSKQILFTATSQGKSFHSGTFQMNEQQAVRIELPLAYLPAGIGSFSLWSDNQVVAERLFYIPENSPVNPTIKLPGESFSTRQKVDVTIKLPEGLKGTANSKMAVTVFNTRNATSQDDKNIENHWNLYYGISNTSAVPVNLFAAPQNAAVIDLFLATQNSRRPLRPAPDTKQPFYSTRIHVTGEAFTAIGEPVPDSAKINLLLQRSVSMYYAYVKNGRFDAGIWMDFFGEEEIFYRVVYNDKILEGAYLVPDRRAVELNKMPEQEEANTFSGIRRSINNSFQYYRSGSGSLKPSALNKEFEDELFAPDVQVKLADYILFPTMAETLREVVPYVQHRKEKGKDVVRVTLRVGEFKRTALEKPLLVIDGIVTDDTDLFMRMKPADILTIKVINVKEKLDMFGDLGVGGIILVETKIPDFALTMPKPETIIKAIGHSEPLSFRAAQYNPSNGRVPDLRTNLFWSPNVVTNEKGEAVISFYTNDIAGDFVIKAEGLTNDGKPFSAQENFEVKFRP
jgi:hypothetical protein